MKSPPNSARDSLLAEIERFIAETGMYPTQFGRDAIGDVALVGRLRKGRDVKLATADRLRAYMANHRKKPSKTRPSGGAERAKAA